MAKRKGGADVTKSDVDAAIAGVEAELGAMMGGRRKRQRGGGCDEATRTRVKIAVYVALGALAYTKGTDIAQASADTVKNTIVNGFELIKSAECTISLSNSGVQNLLCTKYSEILSGVDGFVRNVQTNNGLSTVVTFFSGATFMGAISSVKDGAMKLVQAVKSGAEGAQYSVDVLVDEICKALPGPAAPTSGMDALAAAAATTGGRRSRRSKRTLKKKRSTKRSTQKLSFRY